MRQDARREKGEGGTRQDAEKGYIGGEGSEQVRKKRRDGSRSLVGHETSKHVLQFVHSA